MTMVEKAMTALQNAWDTAPGSLPPLDLSHDEAAHLVRALIAAMRHATVEISLAGQLIIDKGDAVWPSDAVWGAIIDAALAETPAHV